ncbi:hypothetical protein GE061_009133 [Apolygus lucorum]|uniref:Uncharacterized protein n=1 Tax=Apolygus lucorum TaxID=248454 RepID=A0A6A4KGM6_APOLU|nr:hypothetical protein GE061_009133 [Apolygus lucorum]
MRACCLFFLIAVYGSAFSSASNITIGSVLGKINYTTSNLLDGKHNIVTKAVELGNLTVQSVNGFASLALANATEMAQKGVDMAHNMAFQSMNVAKQIGNKTKEFMESLPGGKYMPMSIIGNITSFGVGIGEKVMNSSKSAMTAGLKVSNNVRETVFNKTSSIVSTAHNGVNKVHQKATNMAKSGINSTVTSISKTFSGFGGLLSKFGNLLSTSANITSSG